MQIFGLEITKASNGASLNTLRGNRGGWGRTIYESFTGAWQRNIEVKLDTVLTHHAVFSCIKLISSDIAKMRPQHLQIKEDKTWSEFAGSAPQKLLRRPNRYQNRIQFLESWVQSKMTHGNTYVLKDKDSRGRVVALYVLDPNLVTPLVSDDGQIFYCLTKDNISGLDQEQVNVPADDIIHDRWNTLHHPLVGLSPIYASGLAATQGLAIQKNATHFFQNDSRPSGILTAPKSISDEAAGRIKEAWEANGTGSNYGKVKVLGDGLSYQSMYMSATDSQLIEQLGWSAEVVCGCYGVPAYKVGVGEAPKYDNISALDHQYYSQCLQIHIESIEELLGEHLDLGEKQKVEFNLRDLLRMDSASLIESESEAVKAGIKAPNESRLLINLPPVDGGDSPFLQEQNYSLEALAKRDAQPDPFEGPTEDQQADVLRRISESLSNVRH